jgi:hypothetical protein
MHRILQRLGPIFTVAVLVATIVTQSDANQGGANGPGGAKGALKGPPGAGGPGAQPTRKLAIRGVS